MEDVREEWERVKFSYEILIDPKRRKNYDRNSKVSEVMEVRGDRRRLITYLRHHRFHHHAILHRIRAGRRLAQLGEPPGMAWV